MSSSAQQQAEDARAIARQQQRQTAEAAAMSQPRPHGSHDAPPAAASSASSASVAPTDADQLSSHMQADGEQQMTTTDVAPTPQPQNPNQHAAEASIEAPAGVPLAALTPRLPIAQRCHNDALHCIFAFLELEEMVTVVQACRAWRHAASMEPSRLLSTEFCIPPAEWPSLAASPLRQHIRCIRGVVPQSDRENPRREILPCTLQQVRYLQDLRRLFAVELNISGDSLLDAVMWGVSRERGSALLADYLPSCRELSLSLTWRSLYHSDPMRLWPMLLGALSLVPAPRVEHLTLSFEQAHIVPFDMSALSELVSMTSLVFSNSGRPLLLEEIADLRQLSSLRQLHLPATDGGHYLLLTLLQTLCAPGHQLQFLQTLTLDSTADGYVQLSVPHALQLVSLVSLQDLPQTCFSPDAVSVLPPHLVHASVAYLGNARLTDVIPHLSHISALTSLRIDTRLLDHADMTAVFTAVPLMRSLHVSCTLLPWPLTSMKVQRAPAIFACVARHSHLQSLRIGLHARWLVHRFDREPEALVALLGPLAACQQLRQLRLDQRQMLRDDASVATQLQCRGLTEDHEVRGMIVDMLPTIDDGREFTCWSELMR